MNDISSITSAIQPRANAGTVSRPAGYQANNEVRLRANVATPNESPEQRGAINRLDRAMAADEPPRADVPRGYYLDISV